MMRAAVPCSVVVRELRSAWYRLRIAIALMHAGDCETEARGYSEVGRMEWAIGAWVAADRFRADARRLQRRLDKISRCDIVPRGTMSRLHPRGRNGR